MSKERKALKLALEALITASGHVNNEAFVKVMMARDALVEALAEQPRGVATLAQQQEPVALETVYETIIRWDEGGGKRSRRELARRIVALYTSPQSKPWVGLTDEDRQAAWDAMSDYEDYDTYGAAIEAKLREKNA